jgi:aspartate ammonia-lyase
MEQKTTKATGWYIGYENATRVAQEALRTGKGLAELVLEMG